MLISTKIKPPFRSNLYGISSFSRSIKKKCVIAVLVVSWLLLLSSIFYLVALRTRVGRLQVDTVIHTLTLGGKFGPAIPDSGLAGLGQIKKEFGNRLCRFGEIQNPSGVYPGRVGIDEGARQLNEGTEYL